MIVVYYDVEKEKHITINNVYSVLDDKDDGFVTVCFEDDAREYSKDIPKQWLTSINVSLKKEQNINNSLDKVIASAEQEKVKNEAQDVELGYEEMKKLFKGVENTHAGHVCGHIVFSADGFTAPYSEEERTYVVSSNNKAFQPNMSGYSIYASSLDGSDVNVRIEAYMHLERGGKDGWKVERCYMKREEFDKANKIIGEKEREEER